MTHLCGAIVVALLLLPITAARVFSFSKVLCMWACFGRWRRCGRYEKHVPGTEVCSVFGHPRIEESTSTSAVLVTHRTTSQHRPPLISDAPRTCSRSAPTAYSSGLAGSRCFHAVIPGGSRGRQLDRCILVQGKRLASGIPRSYHRILHLISCVTSAVPGTRYQVYTKKCDKLCLCRRRPAAIRETS